MRFKNYEPFHKLLTDGRSYRVLTVLEKVAKKALIPNKSQIPLYANEVCSVNDF